MSLRRATPLILIASLFATSPAHAEGVADVEVTMCSFSECVEIADGVFLLVERASDGTVYASTTSGDAPCLEIETETIQFSLEDLNIGQFLQPFASMINFQPNNCISIQQFDALTANEWTIYLS